MRVMMIMAMTADGRIAKTHNELVQWTSKADKRAFQELTKECGVLITGRKTYATYGRPLPGRLNVVLTMSPDTHESIPDKLEFTNQSPKELLKNLEHRGFSSVAITGGAGVNALFLDAGLVNELYLTIAPKLFGKGIPLTEELEREIDLKLMGVEKLDNDTVQLHYKIDRSAAL